MSAAEELESMNRTNPKPMPGRLPGKALRALCLVLAAGIAAFPGSLAPSALARGPLRVGDPPPRVTLAELDGGTVRVPDDLRGKVVILHFWAGGCSSCREEMPAMESIYGRYGRKGFTILAVNVGQRKDAVRKFVADLKVSYPIYLDPEAKAAREYEVVGVPKTFMLDRNGVIRYKIVGGASKESLNKLVGSLL